MCKAGSGIPLIKVSVYPETMEYGMGYGSPMHLHIATDDGPDLIVLFALAVIFLGLGVTAAALLLGFVSY